MDDREARAGAIPTGRELIFENKWKINSEERELKSLFLNFRGTNKGGWEYWRILSLCKRNCEGERK
jgi:hypothetical protein